MSKEQSKCSYNSPDSCFSCPFDDCRATTKDLNRQSAYYKKKQLEQRNNEIIQAYNNGATTDGLADRYGMKKGSIVSILNKNGIFVKRGPKEKVQLTIKRTQCYNNTKGGIKHMKNNSAKPNRLKELRDRSRLTLEEVSMITGFAVPSISRHESGGRSLSEEAIAKYSALYKVPTHQLFMEPVAEDDE